MVTTEQRLAVQRNGVKWQKLRLNRTMTTVEYLLKWIPLIYGVQPDERGFRAKCIEELSQVTEIPARSIDTNWGKAPTFDRAPNYINTILNLQNQVNEMYLFRVSQFNKNS